MTDNLAIYNATHFSTTYSDPELSEKNQTTEALGISTNQPDFFKQGGFENFYLHITEDS